MNKYMLVVPSDEGYGDCCFYFPDVEQVLSEAARYGVTKFFTEIPEEEDSQYWEEGYGLLLEVKVLDPKCLGFR